MEYSNPSGRSQGSVLITGGSGLIGRYLTSLLLENGYSVVHLSRKAGYPGRVKVFMWAPEKGVVDPVIFTGVNYIIHLAGANIGEKRWTRKRKDEIMSSRVDTAKLLHRIITDNKVPLRAFISASAIGYYGSVTSENIYTEDDPPAGDFLGTICKQWEEAADLFKDKGIRTVKIRTSVVLEKSDSALSRFLSASKFGLFPRLGNGKQFMPWIHINDLCRIYLMAISDERMSGEYNAVAPDHTDNKRFIRTLATVLKRPFLSPHVPAVLLRLLMGENSVIALKGSRVSCQKIISMGFRFNFPDLKEALTDVLKTDEN